MKKILIVEDDFDLRELLEIIIESEFDNPIISASSGNRAIELLKTQIDIGVVVSDLFMPDGTGIDLFKYNKSSLNVPFLLITGDADQDKLKLETLKGQNSLSGIINKPWRNTDLLIPLREIICDIEKVSVEDQEKLEYKKVSVNSILTYQAFEFNYYIKQNDFDYLPLRQAHSNMSKFLKENRKSNLYLISSDFDNFVKSSIQNLSKKSQSVTKIGDFFRLSASVVDLLVQGSQTLNIQPEDLDKINVYVEKQFDVLSNKESLKEQIDSLKSGHGYLIGHSLIIIQVSTAILKSLGFSEESVISKLIQASLLHDVILDSDFLSSIFSNQSEDFKSLDENRQKLVLNHPLKMSSYLDETQDYPADVIKMIRYHHILPNGGGFPADIPISNVNLTCAIFNISVMASDIYYKNGFTDDSQKQIISNLEAQYMIGDFKAVAKCFLDILN